MATSGASHRQSAVTIVAGHIVAGIESYDATDLSFDDRDDLAFGDDVVEFTRKPLFFLPPST